jgi:hypothetical protein
LSKGDSNSDRGTVKGTVWRRLADDSRQRPATAENATNPYFAKALLDVAATTGDGG